MKSLFFVNFLIEHALESGSDLSVGAARAVLEGADTPDLHFFDQAFGTDNKALLVENGRPTALVTEAVFPDDGCPDAPCSPEQSKAITRFMRHSLDGGQPMTVAKLGALLYSVQGWNLAATEKPVFVDAILAAEYGPTTAAIEAEFGADPETVIVSVADIAAWKSHTAPETAPAP